MACSAIIAAGASRQDVKVPASSPATQSLADRLLAPERTSLIDPLPAELKVKRIERTGHLLVAPQINGQDAGWFIFDTGAGLSCADQTLVQRLKLPHAGDTIARGSGGNQPTTFRRAESLSLGPLTLEGTRLVELDLSGISIAVGEEIAGILGYDCISAATWEIDVAGARITVHHPDRYVLPEEAKWIPLSLESRRPCVPGQIEDFEAGSFVVDTGANAAIAVHGPSVRKLGLLDNRETTPATMGGIGGIGAARTGVLKSISIGGEKLHDVSGIFSQAEQGALQEDTIQATVGLAALKHFVLILHYDGRRAALLPPRPVAEE